jgi:hypothetical protein
MWQLVLCSSILSAGLAYRYCLIALRSVSWSQGLSRLRIHQSNGVLILDVDSTRPWNVRPGQYVYISIMRLGFLSSLQRHPFAIAQDCPSSSMEIRIKPQNGFTKELMSLAAKREPYECKALIEGPYGAHYSLREYGTVVMFATGIGIAGHLSYIKDLLNCQRRFQTKTRDILIIWYMEEDDGWAYVASSMNSLLREDEAWHVEKEDISQLVQSFITKIRTQVGVQDRKLVQSFKTSLLTERNVGISRKSERPGQRPKAMGQNVRCFCKRSFSINNYSRCLIYISTVNDLLWRVQLFNNFVTGLGLLRYKANLTTLKLSATFF